MATGTPVISAVSAQSIVVGMPYELDVGITNVDTDDGDTVQIEGLVEGFYQNWDNTDSEVQVRGKATKLISDAIWTVKVTNQTTTVTSTITWSTVPAAPVIRTVTSLSISRGYDYDKNPILIDITNVPTSSKIEGLLMGLTQRVVDAGIEIIGTLPQDAELTVTSGNLSIEATNNAGMDADTQPFTVVTNFPPSGLRSFTGTPSETSIAFSWQLPVDNGGTPLTAVQVRIKKTEDTDFPLWTSLAATATAHTFTGLDRDTEYVAQARAVGGGGYGPIESVTLNTQYVVYMMTSGQVYVFSVTITGGQITGMTQERVFGAPSDFSNDIHGMGFASNGDLYILHEKNTSALYNNTPRGQNWVLVGSPSVANNARFSPSRKFRLPQDLDFLHDIEVDTDGNLYVLRSDGNTEEIIVYSANTANDTIATEIRRFDLLPSTGLSFQPSTMIWEGGSLRILLYASGNAKIYDYSANTANGADASRTHELGMLPTRSFCIDRRRNLITITAAELVRTFNADAPNGTSLGSSSIITSFTISLVGNVDHMSVPHS